MAVATNISRSTKESSSNKEGGSNIIDPMNVETDEPDSYQQYGMSP